ncbi:hypothetical protein Trichorick_00029 [Candidatus Trichorickettsia mobilis]|uniref:Uncharacterized protein n=1 Tax=Candidatus Trichorickettsia mobilis TaxID=1346319 RepID=A0ABZ0UTG2_9RICK|nr:hypothetical protein [Candidatus Trichorickettsia mobilis]WPY00159.1 hypothetical protein Trichorick_00029 [Candidatus Trichorickettsia mobilis]
MKNITEISEPISPKHQSLANELKSTDTDDKQQLSLQQYQQRPEIAPQPQLAMTQVVMMGAATLELGTYLTNTSITAAAT